MVPRWASLQIGFPAWPLFDVLASTPKSSEGVCLFLPPQTWPWVGQSGSQVGGGRLRESEQLEQGGLVWFGGWADRGRLDCPPLGFPADRLFGFAFI